MPVFAGLSTGRVRITVQGKHLEVCFAFLQGKCSCDRVDIWCRASV